MTAVWGEGHGILGCLKCIIYWKFSKSGSQALSPHTHTGPGKLPMREAMEVLVSPWYHFTMYTYIKTSHGTQYSFVKNKQKKFFKKHMIRNEAFPVSRKPL